MARLSSFMPTGTPTDTATGLTTRPFWEEIQRLSQGQHYSEAFQLLKEHPETSAAYFYNLGTLALKLGRAGPARAYLEKANQEHPHDSEIQFNLNLARHQWKEAQATVQLDPASSWLEQVADTIPSSEVQTATGLAFLILILTWIRGYLKFRRFRPAVASPGALVALFAALIAGGAYGAKGWALAHPPAVCLEAVQIRSGPGEEYSPLGQLTPGAKVRLLSAEIQSHSFHNLPSDTGTTESWQQVQISSQEIGWVRTAALLTL